jgi:Na+/H+-dicarboxylate symporter
MRFLFSLPMQLVAAIVLVLTVGLSLSQPTAAGFYTFSMVFKEFLSAVLPYMVFAFVTSGILSFRRNAPLILGILLALVMASNALGTLVSYVIMQFLYPVIACSAGSMSVVSLTSTIEPFFTIHLPRLIPAHYALLGAIFCGLFFSVVQCSFFEKALSLLKRIIEFLLARVFIPFLPLYVFGFFLKMHRDGTFDELMKHYGFVFLLIVGVQTAYLILYYLAAHGFSPKRAWDSFVVMLPTYLTGFSTMSGTATLPVALEGAEKNTGNRPLVHMALPIMASIHFIGDSVGTPLLAMATLVFFKGCLPAFSTYLVFVFYFCFGMLAASGVPGGGILAITPFLISVFDFTPEMVGVATAIYFLLDSFGTATNITGDGALIILLNRLLKKLRIVD